MLGNHWGSPNKTALIYAGAAAIAWLGTLALAFLILRPSGAAVSPAPPAEAGTIAASMKGSLTQAGPAAETPAPAAPPTISIPEAFEQLQAAALAGQTSAMLDLAELYGRGWGVKQNYSERFAWFQKAAAAGDSRGVFLAALCQEAGLGVTADPAQALAGFQKAANMGLAEAHIKLAELLMTGSGDDPAKPDPVKAVAHLEEALAGGAPLAANILGKLYMEGVAGSLEPDPAKARLALRRGAELGDAEAAKNLAVMHRQGWGGPADPAQALKWFLAAQGLGYQGGGENLETVLTELEAQLAPEAVGQIKAETKTWLEERRAQAETK